jgi:mRNA-degrading endonuclease toxin of MazEF toxin-antitoxin module
VSLAKSSLTHFVGALPERTVDELNQALRVALELPDFAP